MRRRILFILFVAFLSAPYGAFAGDVEADKGWSFNLAPFYLWGINIDGNVGVGPANARVDVPFDDIFDSIEAAFIVHFEALYRNKWGVLVDINYLDLENSTTLPMGISQNTDLDMTLAEVSGYHRVQQDTYSIDLIAGLRYIEMDTETSLIGGPTIVDASKDWVDPLVGGRVMWSLAEGWSLIGRGDVGGFGVGSDFSWHALGVINWQPFKHASFLVGYRALDMDYEEGSGRDYFNFDGTVHGPVIGVNFNW